MHNLLIKIKILILSSLSILTIDIVNSLPLDAIIKSVTQLIIGIITIYKLLKKQKNEQNKPDNTKEI